MYPIYNIVFGWEGSREFLLEQSFFKHFLYLLLHCLSFLIHCNVVFYIGVEDPGDSSTFILVLLLKRKEQSIDLLLQQSNSSCVIVFSSSDTCDCIREIVSDLV